MTAMRVAVCMVLLLACTAVHSHMQNNNIEMNLDCRDLHKRFSLNVTVFNKQLSKNVIQYDENSIYCVQSDYQDMRNPIKIDNKKQKNKVDEKRGQFVTFHVFDLLLEKEGFVQCYVNNTFAADIKSNIKFFRFDNNVFVLKLDVSSAMSDEVIARSLEKMLDHKNYTVSIKRAGSAHVTASVEHSSASVDTEIRHHLMSLANTRLKSEFHVIAVRSTRYCPAYVAERFNLSQSETGFVVTTDFIGVDNYPLNVTCVGDFYDGIYWNKTDIENISNAPTIQPPVSSALSSTDPVSSALSSTDPFDTSSTDPFDTSSTDPIDTSTTFDSPYEVQNFTQKLSAIQNFSASEIPDLATKLDLILKKDARFFTDLRRNLNTSNELLASLDRVLVNAEGVSGVEQAVRPNFAVRVEDVHETQGAGLAVLDPTSDQETMKVHTISQNMTTDNVLDLQPRAALVLPRSLLLANDTPSRLALAVFPRAALFSARPTSAVVSATLGGRHFSNLPDPVRIWFRRDLSINPEAGVCVSWDFSLKEGRGDWSTAGCRLLAVHPSPDNTSVLDECGCWHLTHFGELFSNDEPESSLPPALRPHMEALDTISFAGCVLSLLGLCGVFVTALVCPDWIKGSGHKIQLQISANLAILIIVFLVITNVELSESSCVLLGILLHYSMLSNFCWMLLAAFLQYTRLVKVVSSRSARLPLKSALIGWVLPMVPCMCILVTGQYQVYSQPPLCLPRGIPFFSTILTPLAIVMTCNIVIFLLITRNLYVNIKIRRHDKDCLSFRRFKQLVFLFVLLGLCWIFAFLQLMFPRPWKLLFSYLFCICIACKGVTYFVFFILLDESAKNAWRQRFCPSHARYDVKRFTVNSRLAYSSASSHGATEVTTKPM